MDNTEATEKSVKYGKNPSCPWNPCPEKVYPEFRSLYKE
jgi:hypothetical protein